MTTVFRCVREALEVLADTASPLATPVEIARRKAFAILDGTLLRIDRVGTTGGRDRPYCSGKRRRRGVYVQVLGGSGRAVDLDLAALPGAGHDMGATREHGVLDALEAAGVRVIAEGAYRGAGVNVEVPQRRRLRAPETGQRQRLSDNQKAVNSAHARLVLQP